MAVPLAPVVLPLWLHSDVTLNVKILCSIGMFTLTNWSV